MRRVLPGRRVLLRALLGNPVAVVHDADGLSDDGDAAVRALDEPLRDDVPARARPTRRPTTGCGSSRPARELPFAGHPTLGSAHAWLEAGGVPRSDGRAGAGVRCGPGPDPACRAAGLRRAAAAARRGRSPSEDRARIAPGAAPRPTTTSSTSRWVDNGPGWVGVLLRDAEAVLAVRPDWAAFGDLDIGVVGPYPDGSECAVEVRAFCPASASSRTP